VLVQSLSLNHSTKPPQAEIDLDFDQANPAGTPPSGSSTSSGPYAGNKQGYRNSELSGSQCEADYKESEDALFNSKDPNLVIRHEKPEHRIVIFLKAQGKSNREIAARTGMTEAWVSQILRQPWARARLLTEIREAGRDGVNELLKGAVADSILKVIEIRDTAEKESDQLSAAKDILDRFLGKPTQRVESHNTNLNITPKDMSELDREIADIEAEIGRVTGKKTETVTS
jgi:transcriptional regulator with XRE-family HTH domain